MSEEDNDLEERFENALANYQHRQRAEFGSAKRNEVQEIARNLMQVLMDNAKAREEEE